MPIPFSTTFGTLPVDPGQSFTISVTFTNTGNIVWDFLAGASIWDSSNNEVVDDWSGTIRVQPGQQGNYSWAHSLNTPGEYTLQFGVWKDQSTLLKASPSPKQNLIRVRAPVVTKIIGLSGDMNFGSVQVNTTLTRTLTITNTGNSNLNVTSINYPAGFTGNWGNGSISANGGSQAITVTFAPTAATTYSGTITVNSDKTGGTNTIACSGTGTAPAPVVTAPNPPVLSLAGVGNGYVDLSWTTPSNGGSAITGYKIYRGTASGAESYLNSTTPDWTTFHNPTVVNGTTYYYKVTAVNAVGESLLLG